MHHTVPYLVTVLYPVLHLSSVMGDGGEVGWGGYPWIEDSLSLRFLSNYFNHYLSRRYDFITGGRIQDGKFDLGRVWSRVCPNHPIKGDRWIRGQGYDLLRKKTISKENDIYFLPFFLGNDGRDNWKSRGEMMHDNYAEDLD